MLNPTRIRGMIGSVTMVTISRIAATTPRKAVSSMIAREATAKIFTMSIGHGRKSTTKEKNVVKSDTMLEMYKLREKEEMMRTKKAQEKFR